MYDLHKVEHYLVSYFPVYKESSLCQAPCGASMLFCGRKCQREQYIMPLKLFIAYSPELETSLASRSLSPNPEPAGSTLETNPQALNPRLQT